MASAEGRKLGLWVVSRGRGGLWSPWLVGMGVRTGSQPPALGRGLWRLRKSYFQRVWEQRPTGVDRERV